MPHTKKTKVPAASNSGTTNSTSTRSRQRKRHSAEASPNASDSEEPLQNGSPQIPGNVARKLIVFSIALLIVPILAYFITLKISGQTTPAAVTAAVTANLVLAGYVYAAWIEEDTGSIDDQPKRKAD
ncbi:vacuolar ATPase assembly integral membrane protein vma21 [Coemansia brasiliensis]|uniref:Vacuolar ATPase assembly integral membrane protein vma21 n=1 Tax=Coemansia brasiliensis TaxID=2650707 RepID=A0A9W8I543_9FUNG|nr:vacuolar ATPase assembly integral membrane protein vma21 [Coemansia brasiliensis]